MRDGYGVVVVGSGFGGAVAACRLAQAGQDVAILERGRRFGAGEFPRDWDDAWLWGLGGGPFDIRPLSEVTVVQAAGYGGGSLLYSNVHLRTPPEGFADGWPTGWSRAALDPYYDLVAHMLDISPVAPDQPFGVPTRALRIEQAARRLHREAQFFRPPLAINFGDPTAEVPNRYGVPQRGCHHCGECSIGCNTRAKNSLDVNYLALAERHGAHVATGCEVVSIAPHGGGYELTYRDHGAGGELARVRGERVVLATGAVNTTELLLHCRDRVGSLPALSDQLGEHYSANGDFLGFGLGTSEPFEPSVGPAISAAVLYAEGTAPDDTWFLLQDGGFPAQFGAIVRALHGVDWAEEILDGGLPSTEREWLQRLREIAEERPGDNDPAHCALFLAMGRDSSSGRLRTLPWPWQRPWLHWDTSANQRLYRTEQRLCDEFATELGADPVQNPGWRFLRVPVSVHNLGGCVMADDPRHGVLDPHGEVFGYPNLYVFDGSALPRATGVNPSHTIAAAAERNVEHLIRRLTGDPGWRAPDWREVTPYPDPLPATPRSPTRPVRQPTVGVRSRLAGQASLAMLDGTGTVRLSFDALTLVVDSATLLAAGRPGKSVGTGSVGTVRGELLVHGLEAPKAEVSGGVLVPGKPWRWRLPFVCGQVPYLLEGYSSGRTARLRLRRGGPGTAVTVAVGSARLDLVRTALRTTLTGDGAGPALARALATPVRRALLAARAASTHRQETRP